MLNDSQSPRYVVPRTRRTHSPQFKAELIAACQQPGASIAATAREHGMNANVLHRSLKRSIVWAGSSPPAILRRQLRATSLRIATMRLLRQ